jgi:hypothetical protein
VKWATAGAILLGTALILALTPLTQFLTMGLTNSDLETAAPAGWAVGLIVSFVMVLVAVRLLARSRWVSKRGLVIVYCMLTIAVPMMNMGLARALFIAIRAVQEHYVNFSINTYRTAHQSEKPAWFPTVPTDEGLAWNKAERLLRTLEDRKKTKARENARREVILAISLEAKRPGAAAAPAPGEAAATPSGGADAQRVAALRAKIAQLGPDEVMEVQKQAESSGAETNAFQRALTALGLTGDLDARLRESRSASAAAADRLAQRLAAFDEHEVTYLPTTLAERSHTDIVRLDKDRARLTPAQEADLRARIEAVERPFATLRADVSLLSRADFVRVREARKAEYLQQFAALPPEELARIRTGFVYRSSSEERKKMFAQDGTEGTPNQNLAGLANGVWSTPEANRLRTEGTLAEKLRYVLSRIPWSLWLQPLLRWSALIACLFVFLMCLAEWLRRKWVDRENLAFPAVEIADNIIRHDFALESAEDIKSPSPRRHAFSVAFWVGFLLGMLILTLEALGNYGITAEGQMIVFDVSGKIFTAEFFKKIAHVHFVLSPIVVGLLFLVSLEVSFSIFVVFWIYKFAVALITEAAGSIQDPIYTGWGAGMNFPFQMEQLLGAALAMGALLLFQTWRTIRQEKAHHEVLADPYIPPRLNRAGLIGLPIAIGLLLWNLGVTNVPFMLFIGAIALLLAVVGARVRAESGLPTGHVTYEFTKLPLVFGMTGFTGAKVYTVFISLAFLPVTLLFRLLPQQLENIELARRNRVRYGTVALATAVAFVVAVAAGLFSFLVLAHYRGGTAWGSGTAQGGKGFGGVFSYPLWVSHFLGEFSLDQFTQVHWVRVWAIVAGAAVFGLLTLLRRRVMRFPLHPIGYMLVLLGTNYPWVMPYFKSPTPGGDDLETTWLWGSALVAWLIKKTIVKYGGMNTYKKAKPLFIGLVVGSIFCVFAWNLVDLVASIVGEHLPQGTEPGGFLKTFLDRPPFNPKAY